MYGGRVSDDMDRRILKTYLEEYMGDFLFDNCQKFSFSNHPNGYDYKLPAYGIDLALNLSVYLCIYAYMYLCICMYLTVYQ